MLVVSDKMREQVRQLLALAGDPAASPSEREVALTRASILMARHSITSLDVEAAERERIEVREIILRGGRSTASRATHTAIERVADAAGLCAYYMDRRGLRGNPHVQVNVAGFGSDLDWFMPLASALASFTAAGWVAWRRANSELYRRSDASHRRQLRDGFILGFGFAVADAVRESRATALAQDSADDAPSRALVVRSREAQVAEWAEHLGLAYGASITFNDDTRRAGYTAGRASGLGARTTNVAGVVSPQITVR